MDGFIQQVSDVLQRLAADPSQRTHAMLAGILLATGYIAFRRKKRSIVRIDAPPGERVYVEIGREDEK